MAIRVTRNIGMLLLGIYLILVGLGGLMGLGIQGLLPAIAIIAGVLILIGR